METFSASSILVRRIKLLLLLFSLCSLGCDYKSQDAEKTIEQVGTQIDTLSKVVEGYIKNVEAPEELKKLQQFEYQVIPFSADLSPSGLEEKLNDLGKDRWDCYHFERQDALEGAQKTAKLLAFCKRRPDTPLKYIPKTILSPQ